MPPKLTINPPLLNSSSPWATTKSDLLSLLLSPCTGAITTRTSLLSAYPHDDAIHKYTFFDPATTIPATGLSSTADASSVSAGPHQTASLNCLGYSPLPLSEYIRFLTELSHELPHVRKTCVVSVTGSPEEVTRCAAAVRAAQTKIHFPLAVEVNLSCPNITGKPPPAYDASSLSGYLSSLAADASLAESIPIGVKTPPYTFSGQFEGLISALRACPQVISFVTATNTLGNCLVLGADGGNMLPGELGLGGMAGSPLHPLALGNVATLRKMLDTWPELSHIDITGVGGVGDGQGYKRMRAAGAERVALATAIGVQGVEVFERIGEALKLKGAPE